MTRSYFLTLLALWGRIARGSTFSPVHHCSCIGSSFALSRTSWSRLVSKPSLPLSSGVDFGLTETSRTPNQMKGMTTVATFPRGGGGTSDGNSQGTNTELSASPGTPYNTGTKCPATGAAVVFASLWGTGGVLYILSKAIKRVLPIAMEPFQSGSVPLSQFELGAYIVTCLWFAYVEGYKGFQTKFSPLVVKRSFTLIPGKNGTAWYHYILAPFYSMGLMHATKKRKIVSWSVSIGVAAIVAAVKRLPYPWRNIVDAGVVAGLSWGSISMLFFYLQSWMTGKSPEFIDAALPESVVAAGDSK